MSCNARKDVFKCQKTESCDGCFQECAPDLLEACKIGLQIAEWTNQVRNAPKALTKDIETIKAALAKTTKE